MTVRDGKHAQTTDSEIGNSSVGWGTGSEGEVWHHTDTPVQREPTESSKPEAALLDSQLPVKEPQEIAPDDDGADREGDDDGGRGRRRSRTIARKQMLRERRRMLASGLLPEVVDYERPMTRSDCRDADRPCLYVACRYHLYLDVNPVTGSIKLNFPDKEVWDLEETCALDVAERGGITLEEVGDIMNLTRERIRQVEVSGLQKLKEEDVGLETFIDGRELDFLEIADETESDQD